MTFNNWKSLNIGGNKLKRLVRVSDGLVLFELPSGPDYNEPFWIQGDGVTTNSQIFLSTNTDPSTLSPIIMSYDNKSWTPIEWQKNPFGNSWQSQNFYAKDGRKIYFMRDSEVPISFGQDSASGTYIYGSYIDNEPVFTIGGNINSLICKNFSNLKDISGIDRCFANSFLAESIVNADALLLPAKNIGLSCYSNIFDQDKAQLTSFGVEVPVENIPNYGCYRMLYNSKKVVNGPKFHKLKSVGDYGLADAFNTCSSLTSVELPSTPISVGQYGCNYAFSGSGIKTVENLNLSGIGPSGCKGMFLSCANLEKVDGLSVESLSSSALYGMFSDCSSLTAVQGLHIDNNKNINNKPGNSKCYNMFKNCNSLLSVEGLIKGLYGQRHLGYMFKNCTSLKDASKLSVEINYGLQYAVQMFYNCSELESMPVLLSGEQGDGRFKYQYAFYDCTKLKNVNPLPEVKPYQTMYNQMFKNCTSMTDAPEIMLSNANALNCMTYMFDGCTSLSSVTVHFKTWPAASYLNKWLNGVAPTGIFRCPAELPDERGNGRIPEGWTKVDL